MTTAGIELDAIGARPIPEFDGVHDVWPRGRRLEAVREAAAEFKTRFKAQGTARAIASVDIAAAPYTTAYAFHGAAIAPLTPLISIIKRMVVVQYDDFDGRLRTLVFEPTVADGTIEAPFYADLDRRTDRIPGGRRIAEALYLRYYNEPDSVLPGLGLTNEDVDFLTFDHLHVQDPRLILPIFPNAKLLAHRREVATFESPHPMQWAWYVDGGMDGVDPDRLALFDGDIELGVGVALIWTPGHTDGNHSLCVNTPDGVWITSENGIALDNWQPDRSRIPGLRSHAQRFGREAIPNANTLEDALDQYDSMVKEKTLADPCRRDPRWLQVLPSSELADWKHFWPVRPTFAHGGIQYG
jgi:glyoxylase-like metal-dependent hydrolase (beta-lactamase superfamily II)